jgi:hypothetical protein
VQATWCEASSTTGSGIRATTEVNSSPDGRAGDGPGGTPAERLRNVVAHDGRRKSDVVEHHPAAAGGVGPNRRDQRTPAWSGIGPAARHAAGMGRSSIGTEHLLLALCDAPADDPARGLLADAGVDGARVTSALRAIHGLGHGPLPTRAGDLLPAPRTIAVLRRAGDLAAIDRAEGDGVGPAGHPAENLHVLAALLDSPDPGLARLVLDHLGVTDRLRRTVVERTAGRLRPDVDTARGRDGT